MNVELVNPTMVLRLFSGGDDAKRRHTGRRAGQARARLDERRRYRRALQQLHQLDDRELDDLDLARADLRALGRRHAKGTGATASIAG